MFMKRLSEFSVTRIISCAAMKPDYLNSLSGYSLVGIDSDDVEFESISKLGLALPNLRCLERAVLGDLRESPPYGISQWDSSLDAEHRIFIRDQLYACTESISSNLSEAGLHRLEFLNWSERENALFSIELVNGERRPIGPQSNNALQALTPRMTLLHMAGVTRALSSALDCLAGTIVGIIALPSDILKADFKRVRGDLEKIRKRNEFNENTQRLADFSEMLEKSIVQSGPGGWIEWLLDYRNMLVHRGRRLQMGQLVPSNVLGPDGLPARAQRITHLPCDPGRSDAEVFRGLVDINHALLREDVRTTLDGLIKSTSGLIEAVAVELYRTWKWRRQYSNAIVQPKEQWQKKTYASQFLGYKPGEFNLSLSDSIAQMHPTLVKRLRAAEVIAPPEGDP